jgi:hypothetical protein
MLRITEPLLYKLLKTGQTTQYAGYNDDGFYEMGVAKEYDVLTLGVYSGHTHIIMNVRDEPHGNACVYDRRTQLMWSRYVPVVVGPAGNGKMSWTTNVNGEGIFAYCGLANAALLAGYSDWRIPNVFELFSLPDEEQPSGLPNAVVFPVWPADFCWTSTSLAFATVQALGVNFSWGHVYPDTKTNANEFCVLVRGG